MALSTNKVGLLFTEIDSGRALRSTGDRVILGSRNSQSDQEWIIRQKISECGASVTEAVHACGGIVAQRAAESVFSTFPNARGALEAAQWVKGRQGWFTMRDVLGLDEQKE